MSKIKQLKRDYPSLNKSIIDVIAEIVPVKYLDTYIRLSYEKFNHDRYYFDLQSELSESWNVPKSFLDGKTYTELLFDFGLLDMFTSRDTIKTILEFAKLNDKKLIANNDLRSYKSFSEMNLQISISELRSYNKDLEKEIETIFEDNDWKLLKPLSWLASKKYGAGTRWCTAMEKDSVPFVRYSKRGILIYAINKKSGLKVAGFKNLDIDEIAETSFWNAADNRIDSMESNLPIFILDIFKEQFSTFKLTNWELFNDESKNVHYAMIKKMEIDDDIRPMVNEAHELEHVLTRRVTTPYNTINIA